LTPEDGGGGTRRLAGELRIGLAAKGPAASR
jgi:hypothetical protein